MASPRAGEGAAASGPRAHYMIRVDHVPREEPQAVEGVIERLGTGEKQRFASAAELVHLVTDWPELET